METLATHVCFGGTQGFYRHVSTACAGAMRFAVYVPPHAVGAKLPAVLALAGLTCTEETFAIKAGAQRVASELGLILVMPVCRRDASAVEGALRHVQLRGGRIA